MNEDRQFVIGALRQLAEETREGQDLGTHPPVEDLVAYQAGELLAEADWALKEHLLLCPDCSALVLASTDWRSSQERELLEEIGRGLPRKAARRYRALIAKRGAESLTTEEYAELLQLTDWVEKLEAKRLESLAELATLRGVSFKSLLNEPGIRRR